MLVLNRTTLAQRAFEREFHKKYQLQRRFRNGI